MKITIYTPVSPIRTPRKMVVEMWRDLIQSRELSWRLAIRDLKGIYRQSFLGIFWAFLLPFANTLTWIFLKGSGILQVASTDIPYPVYVLTGTLLWSIIMDSIQAPLTQINAAKDMLSKINFPREALIVSGILQTLFHAIIKVAIIIIALFIIKINLGWSLLLFPLAIVTLVLAGTTIGVFLTPVGMLYTDIGKFIPLAMQFFMFVTPVVFPIPESGWVRYLFIYNPITPLIMTARAWLTTSPVDFLNGFIIVSAVCILLLFLVWIVYRAAMPILIERMNT